MSETQPLQESAYSASHETSISLEQIQQEIDGQRDPRPSLDVEYAPPRTPTERKLAEIWAELLHIEKIGVNDDFFQLGGHSLLAVEAITRINREFSVEVAMQALFGAESTTLAEFARIIEVHQLQNVDNDDLESALQEINKLSDDEVKRLLAEME